MTLASPAPPGPVRTESAVARVRRLEVLALMLSRIGALVNLGVGALALYERYAGQAALAVVTLALLAESVLLVAACRRAGRLVPALIVADSVVTAAALAFNGWAIHVRVISSDGFYVFTYSVVSSVVIGVAFRRFPAAVASILVLVAGDTIASEVAFPVQPVWGIVFNAVSYLGVGCVAWAVVYEVRRMAGLLDTARTDAVTQATIAARERERARHARMLHDRVLQTLEMLARGGWIDDQQVRHQVTAEAAWLRALVEGTGSQDRPGDLLAALHAVIEHKSREGLRIDLVAAALAGPDSPHLRLAPEPVEALVGAAFEALTNVRKHAGTDRAMIRAGATRGGVAVAVVDHGLGFDTATARTGAGLSRSIRGRIADVGGTVTVESGPGDGTRVELWVPLPEPA